MPNRVPLVANPDGSYKFFQEVFSGDNLDMSESGITNCSGIGATFVNVTGVSTFPRTIINGQLINSGLATVSAQSLFTGIVTFTSSVGFNTSNGFGNVSVGGTFKSAGISTIKDFRTQSYCEEILYASSGTISVTYASGFGNLIYINNPSGNSILDLTLPTSDPLFYGSTLVYTIIINQGGTARIVNAVNINGTAKTINWYGGSAPSGNANKKDVMVFTLVNTSLSSSNAADFTVLGILPNNFGT